MTVLQARACAALGAEGEDLMSRALLTVAQQRALGSMLETGQVKVADLNAIANLISITIAQRRQSAEVTTRS